MHLRLKCRNKKMTWRSTSRRSSKSSKVWSVLIERCLKSVSSTISNNFWFRTDGKSSTKLLFFEVRQKCWRHRILVFQRCCRLSSSLSRLDDNLRERIKQTTSRVYSQQNKTCWKFNSQTRSRTQDKASEVIFGSCNINWSKNSKLICGCT